MSEKFEKSGFKDGCDRFVVGPKTRITNRNDCEMSPEA